MKKFRIYSILLLVAVSLISMSSCSKDEDESESTTYKVVINDDGTTSNGSIFYAIDDNNFYLDSIKYTVVEGHLAVSGFVGGLTGTAKIASSITYKQNTYEVLDINRSAFSGCKGLTSITIPNSVTGIGDGAFNGCYGLTSITIPNSVIGIGDDAFNGCYGLTSITIPNSVTIIGNYAFWNCTSLSSITISNSVTSIGGGAFGDCVCLASITIPSSVASIGGGAFTYCTGLTEIHCLSTTPPANESDYLCDNKTSENIRLYVPKGSLEAYKRADGWRWFSRIVEE